MSQSPQPELPGLRYPAALGVVHQDGSRTPPPGPPDGPPATDEPHYWDRISQVARETLPPHLYKVFGALSSFRQGDSRVINPTDEEIAVRARSSKGIPCRGTIQRRLADLEEEGWVKRGTRHGQRFIEFTFDLRSKDSQSCAAPALHACSAGATGAPRPRCMHVAPARRQDLDLSETNQKDLPQRPRGGSAALGGPPPPAAGTNRGGTGTGKIEMPVDRGDILDPGRVAEARRLAQRGGPVGDTARLALLAHETALRKFGPLPTEAELSVAETEAQCREAGWLDKPPGDLLRVLADRKIAAARARERAAQGPG